MTEAERYFFMGAAVNQLQRPCEALLPPAGERLRQSSEL